MHHKVYDMIDQEVPSYMSNQIIDWKTCARNPAARTCHPVIFDHLAAFYPLTLFGTVRDR